MRRNLSRNIVDGGVLILVVGPSGVGKDSLIDAARAALEGEAHVVFMQRDITRPAGAGGEQHKAIDEASFREAEEGGAYALSWAAHGQLYGIPRTMEEELRAGRTVVVNASRAVMDDARARYSRVIICHITAPADVLRARLSTRGRETPAEIEERVSRAGAFSVAGNDVVSIPNDAVIEQSVRRLIDVIRSAR